LSASPATKRILRKTWVYVSSGKPSSCWLNALALSCMDESGMDVGTAITSLRNLCSNLVESCDTFTEPADIRMLLAYARIYG
jgi:hypothetical protein